ncbi:DUF3365 domain-containing protein [uncultured Mesonia sp.]|uniref:Tll0287-like domain-containing protein n=1 Tax=uncultured Mesonia sp. TaxID=399731 RepID=UPI00374E7DE4
MFRKKTLYWLLFLIVFIHCKPNTENKEVAKEQKEVISQEEALAIGQDIAVASQQVLGKNLKQAIEKEGVLGAITFCNTAAIRLTDSMATAYKFSIKRLSDKPRNQMNQASRAEEKLIAAYSKDLAAGKNIRPSAFKKENGGYRFYQPIVSNKLCLNCHGVVGQQVNEKTFAQIKALYPNDKATGYAANQIRGLWAIDIEN